MRRFTALRNTSIAMTLLVLTTASTASAQDHPFEVGTLLAVTFQDELDATDFGFGGRFGFEAIRNLTIEGELTFYSKDLPEAIPVTTSRLEGLFGVKVGPRFDGFSIFGKARGGFVRFAGAPGPVACILIYPPPLSCVLAEGQTVPALDLGGGIEIHPVTRGLIRIDVSSLLLRYPGPAFTREREAIVEDSFWRSNLRLTVGVGMLF